MDCFEKFIGFLASELCEPIIKQYLDNCTKNAQRPVDKLLFVAKSSNEPKSEMLGVKHS